MSVCMFSKVMATRDIQSVVWLILFNLCSNFANAHLSIRPTDMDVLVNHSTYFNCSTSTKNINADYVLWYHYPLDSPSRNDVYDEGKITYEYKDRFRIETSLSEGVFNLVVVSPRVQDAGKYECQDERGVGDRASAELIVLDGNPSCAFNVSVDGIVGENSCGLEPDNVQLTCHVASSHGNIPPSLEWKVSGDKSNSSLVVCEHSASCNVTLKGDRISNNQSFVCQTTTSTGEPYACLSGPVRVKYAIKPTVTVTSEGDVKCSASSNRPCTYKWYNAKHEEVSQSEMLRTEVPGEYKCEAECDMNRRNESCRFIGVRFSVVPPDKASYTVLWVTLLCLALGICSVIVGFILYKRRKSMVISARKPNATTEESKMEVKNDDGQKKPLLKSGLQDDAAGSNKQPSAELKRSMLTITEQDVAKSLLGNFIRDESFIDTGGSGAIYGPYGWKDGKCALKRILFSPDNLTKAKEEQINEQINCCKALKHPHLVTVFEMQFQSPAFYVLMEYAEAKSLDKILRPKEPSDPLKPFLLETVQNWALQIAEGMRYLHEEDVIHRNLKAAHVLVMESPDILPNTLKICSYTLIKEHDHSTVTSLKGTMAWMAPEYILNEPFSKLSDVWSYGVTIWEILTRDLPHKDKKKEMDLVTAARNKMLNLNIPVSCPQTLKSLLTKCWNYEVGKRPPFIMICEFLNG